MGSVGWEMAGDTLSRLYISLAFPFFLLFSGFHLDGSLDSVPPSAVLETSSLFLFPFSPTPQTMVREARRFLAAGGAFVSRSHTCFSSGLFHKNTPSSLGLGGRSGIDFRGCIPFLVFIFRSYGTLDVGVSLVYPHSIRYPPGLYLDQVARQYENCFFSFKKVPRHTDCRRGCRCPRPRSGRITACKAERPDAMEGRGPSMGRELTDS